MAMKFPTITIICAAFAQAAHVHFNLDLTWQKGSPNGFTRDMVFINNKFPGPLLLIDEGDEVTEIDVTNNLHFNTSIHFHGIEQRDTPDSDGVSGISQWPIQPGQTYRYHWRANDYGTYWYHSHDRSRIMDGMYGAIRVRPSPGIESPFWMISDGPSDIEAMKVAERNTELVLLSDWTHLMSDEYMQAMHESGYDIFCSDSILINGQGSVYCKDPEELTSLLSPQVKAVVNETLSDRGCAPFLVTLQGEWEHYPESLPDRLNSGCVASRGHHAYFRANPKARWASFSFISAASIKSLVFSIDEHRMFIYEVDGRYIEPQLAHKVDIYNGERYSVMVKLDRTPANYTIRIAGNGNQVISGFATLSYQGGEQKLQESEPYIDYGGVNTTTSVIPLNTTQLPPYPPSFPATKADDFHLLTLGRINSSWQWTLDGTTFLPSDLASMRPIILDPYDSQLDSALQIKTRNNTWVDIVFQLAIPEPTVLQPPHPIHKHSNKAYLIGRGLGPFKWDSIEDASKESPQSFFSTPVFRDTFVTAPNGESWLAIRYHVQNPGAFFLHCHIETHFSSGQGLVILDGIDSWRDAFL